MKFWRGGRPGRRRQEKTTKKLNTVRGLAVHVCDAITMMQTRGSLELGRPGPGVGLSGWEEPPLAVD